MTAPSPPQKAEPQPGSKPKPKRSKPKAIHGLEEERFSHHIEFALAKAGFWLIRRLGIDCASALGGTVLRWIGPFLPHHKVALDNLTHAFPEKSESEIKAIAREMWENFGRTACEYPFLDQLTPRLSPDRMTIKNVDILDRAIAEDRCVILVGGHLGNWEVQPAILYEQGRPTTGIYRATNNPLVNDWLVKERERQMGTIAPKGTEGAKALMKAIRRKELIAILVDQKMREGRLVPFFGRPCRTPDFAAEAVMRFGALAVPVSSHRVKGARFEISVQEPFDIPPTGDHEQDVMAFLEAQNAFLEAAIRKHPAQWLWMHNRWTASLRALKRRKGKSKKTAKSSP